uniref:IST1-like protein n=1 Tax=Glycine max TaxID=3847 RepID=I1LT17_SOYBN
MMQIEKKKPSRPMWSYAIRDALACVGVSGWKKAFKCENLIMQFQAQLNIQKNRRRVIIVQSRADIAQLLEIDKLESAFSRLCKDTCLLTAYDLIDNFCECLITNMSFISKCSSVHNLPINVVVAIASLTYASSRCGELSLLHLIRNLFRERYGREFDITNVELFAGNYVDLPLRKNLSNYSVLEDEKLMLLNEIAHENFNQQLERL